jgi:hypothetical protein
MWLTLRLGCIRVSNCRERIEAISGIVSPVKVLMVVEERMEIEAPRILSDLGSAEGK